MRIFQKYFSLINMHLILLNITEVFIVSAVVSILMLYMYIKHRSQTISFEYRFFHICLRNFQIKFIHFFNFISAFWDVKHT